MAPECPEGHGNISGHWQLLITGGFLICPKEGTQGQERLEKTMAADGKGTKGVKSFSQQVWVTWP